MQSNEKSIGEQGETWEVVRSSQKQLINIELLNFLTCFDGDEWAQNSVIF